MIDTQPRLKLPTAPATAVFRAIVNRLKADPTLARVVGEWQTWDGDTRSAKPPGRNAVVVGLTPTFGPSQFWTPGSQAFPLLVHCELAVPTACSDDVTNLFGAFMACLFPADTVACGALARALQAAGSLTGLINFLPAADPRPGDGGDGVMRAYGQLTTNVRINT